LLKARYAPIFERALEAALASLVPRERTMLRLHFADGMTLTAIARSFSVAVSTVQRTILRVREQILERTLGALGEELGIEQSQAESVVRLVQSRIDLDLRACLATRPSPS
jgi:RNA polymerase sigma-70 factor (ECF subfamily)